MTAVACGDLSNVVCQRSSRCLWAWPEWCCLPFGGILSLRVVPILCCNVELVLVGGHQSFSDWIWVPWSHPGTVFSLCVAPALLCC